ncbi:hypothetical protein IMCC20628_03570 [Hoeflea sp. IMCC20628]|nr:hypothetical protein IMCC20628_03570 [Hoeflea sp. IMCC20628]
MQLSGWGLPFIKAYGYGRDGTHVNWTMSCGLNVSLSSNRISSAKARFFSMLSQPCAGNVEVATTFARLGLRSCPSCGNSGPLQSFTASRYLSESTWTATDGDNPPIWSPLRH